MTQKTPVASANLVVTTANAEDIMGYCARVSSPENQGNDPVKLLRYCIKNGHWSVFEMANMVVEINTTRDITHQIIRHRSFSFQEFSQRYADVSKLGTDFILTEARMQDNSNRQNSLPVEDGNLQGWWDFASWNVQHTSWQAYTEALAKGIAKEVARKVLPEGLTRSRLYMNGTCRSWVHYLQSRLDPSTQKEHREVAQAVLPIFQEQFPNVYKAVFE